MIKIAVCEDNLCDLNNLKSLLSAYQKLNANYCLIIDYFSNPIDLLDYVETFGGYDLYVLDIVLAPIKGSKLALELKSLNKFCEIIFITSSKNHAIFAYQIEALQYLLKPVDKSSLFKTLDRFLKNKYALEKYAIIIKTTTGLYKLNTNAIIFSEPEKNNYQAIILSDQSKLVVRMTVTQLYKLLSINPNFVRCGASLNINLKYILSINDAVIIFDNNSKLTYPYKAYSKLKQDFLNYKLKCL